MTEPMCGARGASVGSSPSRDVSSSSAEMFTAVLGALVASPSDVGGCVGKVSAEAASVVDTSLAASVVSSGLQVHRHDRSSVELLSVKGATVATSVVCCSSVAESSVVGASVCSSVVEASTPGASVVDASVVGTSGGVETSNSAVGATTVT